MKHACACPSPGAQSAAREHDTGTAQVKLETFMFHETH